MTEPTKIKSVLVLGAGSAGLIAALSLKRKIPQITVRIVRSPDIGVIGVGEGTTPNFPVHLFDYLGISRRQFYAHAQPTWKIGIRFLWGPRGQFFYGFGRQLDSHWTDLPRPNGYYCDESFENVDLPTALMSQGKVFAAQQSGGGPDIQGWHGFHIENKKLVEVLEMAARAVGVEIVDGRVTSAERGPKGIASVILEDGQRLEADFFVDSSGFRSELLGRALEEPYVSFGNALFCDRAVVGGWDRAPDEPILPYTTAETMDAGWAWQIEHEHHVNRGYVYASQFISDDDARAEFERKNPKAPKGGRVVKFRSGRYRRGWVDNVVGIGNACGFVEPLEATALMVVCSQCQTLVDFLLHTGLSPTQTMRDLYNHMTNGMWDEIRDFLALHYKLNTLLDTPFWRHCREHTDLSGVKDLLQFYYENGPTGFGRHLLQPTGSNFGIEGFLVMMVGNKFPYMNKHEATSDERQIWDRRRAEFADQASKGMTVAEALTYVRHPAWRWFGEQ
jgi:tryptophan halogenase